MAKMLKTRLPSNSIVWIAPITGERMSIYPRSDEPFYYVLRIREPYARITGCTIREKPPVELLQSMGIKVLDRGEQYQARWKVIGCRYQEVPESQVNQLREQLHPDLLEHLKSAKGVTNQDMETLMHIFEEWLPTIGNIKELHSFPDEEGWTLIR